MMANTVNPNETLPGGQYLGAMTPQRDGEYFFELIVFQVGDTIFRVPKHGFNVPGTVFEHMFSLPKPEGDEEGTVLRPIGLPVDVKQFRGFLRVMYPFDGITVGTEDWLNALHLSTMWLFDKMRRRSIEQLGSWVRSLPAKQEVLLAKQYRVLKWLKEGYSRLLQENGITADHLHKESYSLDWETTSRVLSCKLRPGKQDPFSLSPDLRLELEFKAEFSDMTEPTAS